MIFGAVAVDACAGAILAHGLRVTGAVFKKGRILSAADVAEVDDLKARYRAGTVGDVEVKTKLAAAIIATATCPPRRGNGGKANRSSARPMTK